MRFLPDGDSMKAADKDRESRYPITGTDGTCGEELY